MDQGDGVGEFMQGGHRETQRQPDCCVHPRMVGDLRTFGTAGDQGDRPGDYQQSDRDSACPRQQDGHHDFVYGARDGRDAGELDAGAGEHHAPGRFCRRLSGRRLGVDQYVFGDEVEREPSILL